MSSLIIRGVPRKVMDTTPDFIVALPQLLRFLSYRERAVLELRYGLTDAGPYTLEETARIFRVHRERIRQIQLKAERHLRGLWSNWLVRDSLPRAHPRPARRASRLGA